MRTGRLGPSSRLSAARLLLARPQGATLYELAGELDISLRTAHRYMRELELSGEPMIEEQDMALPHRKRWKICWIAPAESVRDACRALGVHSIEEFRERVRELIRYQSYSGL